MFTPAVDEPLAPELADVATAAEQHLRAVAGDDPPDTGHLAHVVAQAASAAISAVHPIAAVASAEQLGHRRARAALTRDLLARVERAARRRRDAEHDLHDAIGRAGRLGLPQRDIATAAHVAHATIRAILTRATSTEPAPATGHDDETLRPNGDQP